MQFNYAKFTCMFLVENFKGNCIFRLLRISPSFLTIWIIEIQIHNSPGKSELSTHKSRPNSIHFYFGITFHPDEKKSLSQSASRNLRQLLAFPWHRRPESFPFSPSSFRSVPFLHDSLINSPFVVLIASSSSPSKLESLFSCFTTVLVS